MQSKQNLQDLKQNQSISNTLLGSEVNEHQLTKPNNALTQPIDHRDKITNRPNGTIHPIILNGSKQHNSPPLANGVAQGESHKKEPKEVAESSQAPVQTFELQNFDKLHENFDSVHHQVMPKVELTQAHMMTTNLKEAAGIVTTGSPCAPAKGTGHSEAPVSSGQAHFHKHDYVNSLLHTCLTQDMHQLSRLLLNLGPHDKSSNFLLEQRSLHRSQALENRPIRDLLEKEVVGDEEWVRVQEQLSKAKAEAEAGTAVKAPDNQFSSPLSSETQEDSGQNPANIESNGKSQDAVYDSERIAKVITQIRRYGQKYLAPKDGHEYASNSLNTDKQFTFSVKQLQERVDARRAKSQVNDQQQEDPLKVNIAKKQDESLYESLAEGAVPLVTICKKLRKDKEFKDHQSNLMKKQQDGKKRDCKASAKKHNGAIVNDVYIQDTVKEKSDLKRKIHQIETVMSLEKRLKVEEKEDGNQVEDKVMTATEIDLKPVNSRTFEIQNALFDFCGINLDNVPTGPEDQKDNLHSHQGRVERFFGKIRKLPNNSSLLQNYGDKLLDLNEEEQEDEEDADDELKKTNETRMVKLIGLQPEKLFEKVPKYRIHVDKLPHFSCDFDPIDSLHPSLTSQAPLPSHSLLHPLASPLNFQRIDGRPVISLHFNPFSLNPLPGSANTSGGGPASQSPHHLLYSQQMHEILATRSQLKSAPRDSKLKQEQANFKRAWQNIVKKDIPKAYRMYQKAKADQDNNNRKLSQNCLKEVRKRAVRTQRLAKESVMRARRLTKDMVQFWRRRDREIADSKRKREKIDKELKKRQQEEEEALLQKKRLEYLMQQSEIYAHFMSTKLGVNDEHKKGQDNIGKDNFKKDKRLEIDKKAARKQIAGIINENRKRLDEFDNHERDEIDEEDLNEVKFNEPTQLTKSVTAPKIFKGDLKAYQLKGLQWLDNLYDQGINGILADEMGLGKTIQAISLMAHLAEKKNVWGPFLIVVPVTTLHNWQNELSKFCPDLKVLPYFGSAEERKKLAKFLDPKNLYNPAMRIHVLITSYNIVVGGNTVNKDQMRLQRVKWHYMILDEAQAIKNNQSRRWKTLLQFQTRNRLLLSGTPIQNSMAELWALLHFIMPKLFDNHEQFQDWFSKDIEQHSMDQGELNKHQLKRLHLILQPFMLRRLKKDVEQEIAPKIEETISCEMTHRQKVLYDRIKRKISVQDLFQTVKTKAKMENLMNLVMQFRKVCNHPDLFEKRQGKIPFVFSKMNHGMQPNLAVATKPEVVKTTASPITYHLSKLIFDECFFVSENCTRLFTRYAKNRDVAHSTVSVSTHFTFFNIFNEQNLHQGIYHSPQGSFKSNTFSILGLLARSNNWSLSTIAYLATAQSTTTSGDLLQTIALLHFYSRKAARSEYLGVHSSALPEIATKSVGFVYSDKTSSMNEDSNICYRPDAMVSAFVSRNDWSILYRSSMEENLDLSVPGQWVLRESLIPEDISSFLGWGRKVRRMVQDIYYSKVICDSIEVHCESTAAKRYLSVVKNNPMAKKVLIGKGFKPARDYYIGKVGRDRSSLWTEDDGFSGSSQISKMYEDGPPNGYSLINSGLLDSGYQIKGSSTFQLPDYSRMITDCSKMAVLAKLLIRLNREGHRCLIFCQMTKMMDILEDFLIWQKMSYFRMDGSTMLQDRRFMVEEYQTNPNIFAFILSTRAGGLGINLIAADTVIFYDNDWNPTMDSQATDRAHRIGQRKTVHVYRLVTKNTVEERILQRARQKESVQSTVYGANLKADAFSARDAVEMIYDDIAPGSSPAPAESTVKGFIKGTGKSSTGAGGTGLHNGGRKGKKSKKNGGKGGHDDVDESGSGKRRRVARREEWSKYDKEWEQLVGVSESVAVEAVVEVEEEAEIAESGSDLDGDVSQESEIDMRDAKNRLLKMLEQKGAAKQVFTFQEDEGQEIAQQMGAKAEGQIKSANKVGRPRNQPANGGSKNQNLEDEEMDDGEEDEEPEY